MLPQSKKNCILAFEGEWCGGVSFDGKELPRVNQVSVSAAHAYNPSTQDVEAGGLSD